MRKMMMCGMAFLLGTSMAFADVFAPTVMSLSGPDHLYGHADGSPLDFSVSSTVPGSYYFLVFTKDKTIENGVSGNSGWHQVNGIDTCLYVSVANDMLATSSNSYSWTVKDEDGNQVPEGDYTYYLWGVDTKGTRAQATAGTTAEGGGSTYSSFNMGAQNWRTIITHDSVGVALQNPILYIGTGLRSNAASGANYDTTRHICRKWVLGNNWADPTLYETCITRSRTCTGGLYFYMPSPNTFFKHVFYGNGPEVSGFEIRKYTWVPNDFAVQDQTWGNGVDGHIGSFYVDAKTKYSHVRWYMGDLASDGATLWFVDANQVDSGKSDFTTAPVMHAVDLATGFETKEISLEQYWLDLGAYSNGGYNVAGPLSLDYRKGYLALNAHTTCLLQMVNPSLGLDEGFYVWTNGNQEPSGVGDKNAPTRPWLCNDSNTDPYKYNLAFDDNLFSVFPCYQYAQSFGLVAPDGTGIQYIALAGETNAIKYGVEIIDYGSSDSPYDGLYTTKPTGDSTTNSGWYFVGQDSFKGTITLSSDVAIANPVAFSVKQNSPNPFNPTTTIQFTLMQDSKTTVEVFNAAGQKVDMLVNGNMKAGTHKVTWNAAKFSAGVYFYTVKSGSFSKTMKMTLLK